MIRRKIKPADPPAPGAKGKAPAVPPGVKFTCTLADVEDATEKDKKGGAGRMLPIALDKKNAIVSIGGPGATKGHDRVCDELMVGDIIISVDGKKWSGPMEMKSKAQRLDPKIAGDHILVVERPPLTISPENWAELGGDAQEEMASKSQPPAAAAPKPVAPPPAAAPPPPPKPAAAPAAAAVAAAAPKPPPPSSSSSSSSASSAEREFLLSGWSNSSKTFKQIASCKIGGALTADLPQELGLTYVKKEDMEGLMSTMQRFTGTPTGDDGRLKALMTFFNQHTRVGRMEVGAGGADASVLFFAGTTAADNAVEPGCQLVFYRTPSAVTKAQEKLGQLKPPPPPPPAATAAAASSQPPPPAQPKPAPAPPAATPPPPAATPAVVPPPPKPAAATPSPVPPIQPPAAAAQPPPSLPKAPTAGIEAAAGVNALGEKIGPLGVGISPKNSSRGSARKPPPPIKEEDESVVSASPPPKPPPATAAAAKPPEKPAPTLPVAPAGSSSSSSSSSAAAASASAAKPAPGTPATAPKPATEPAPAPAPPKQSSFMPPAKASAPAAVQQPAEAPAAKPSGRPVAPSLAIEKAAAAVGIGSPRDSSKPRAQSDRTPGNGRLAKPAAHGSDSYRSGAAAFSTPGVMAASMSYRAPSAADVKTQRYPATPAISIGVNQASRSPSRMSGRSLSSPTPAGGLFSFSIPAASASKALSAREKFELTSRSDYKKRDLIPLDKLGVTDLSAEEYVTPRSQLGDDAKRGGAELKVTITKAGGASRIKGLSKFFEQFSDGMLEA